VTIYSTMCQSVLLP